MLTEDELKAIEERERAATRGPWQQYTDDKCFVVGPDGDSVCRVWGNLGMDDGYGDEEVCEFIAHARTDIPALLQHIREQAAELEMLRAFAGGEVFMSDFRSADEMRAEIYRLRNENAMQAASISFLKLPSGIWEPNDKSKDELQRENTQLRERVAELERVRESVKISP